MHNPFLKSTPSRSRLMLLAGAVWIIVTAASLVWNWYQVGKSLIVYAESEARASFQKDLSYRRWASIQGGVYVPPTDTTPPNPYLTNYPDRDVTTTSGKQLTLINPAYMTRQMYELSRERYGLLGHITSLHPIRPENAGDVWEIEALRSFHAGTKEVVSVEKMNGQPYLRLMRPLFTEASCVKCHGEQGYKEGDILGGISISVPLAPYTAASGQSRLWLVLAHALIAGLGLIGLGAGNAVLRGSEKALAESERYYRKLIHSLHEDLLVIDRDYRITDINNMALQTLGRTRHEVIGRLCYEVAHGLNEPCDKHGVPCPLRRVFDTGEPVNCPHEHTMADGKLVRVDILASPIKDSEGIVTHVIEAIRDISDLFEAQEALRKNEAFLNTLLDAIPIPVYYKDKAGRYLGSNRAYETISGVTREQLIGKTAFEVHPPELAGIYHAKDMALFESGEIQQHEYQIKNAHGVLRDVISSKAVFTDSRGVVGGLIGTMLDITKRKQAEKELKSSNDLLRVIIEAAPTAIIGLDLDGNVHSVWNPAAEKMLGWSAREVMGRPLPSMKAESQDEFRRFREQIRSGKILHGMEVQRQKRDGTPIDYSIYASPLYDAEGHITGNIAVLVDITERKKLEEQLRQAQKMEAVGQLAGGVAHDSNNMLGVIIGHTELAMDQLDPSQPLFVDLREIRKAAERSADLTRQLLAFARKQTVAPKVLDLNETIKGMLKMLRRLIGEDIDLAWLPEIGLWSVKMDPSQIDQILANLCVNARDAISGMGKVTIETGMVTFDEAYCAKKPGFIPGDFVVLAVSDDGHGMDKKTLGKIFEPFFTTKEKGEGTGLGLATVYGIVKQNNGFINVYSEPGHGTTFRIYLPRHAAKTEPMRKESPATLSAKGHETILLVEDEPAILQMGMLMLERFGYRVLTASTPGKAIRAAKEHAGEIHLLITDVVMPEMNGRDLAKNLISLYPKLRHLFMSGYTGKVIAHHGVLDEGENFIQKPFSMQVLADKVREVLDRR